MTEASSLFFLIIDDDPTDRRILAKLLNEAYPGCRIVEAAGSEQIRRFDDVRCFDAVLIDLVMPEVDGLSALRQLKVVWPYSAFIVVTGRGDERTAADAIKSGAADYIPKDDLNHEALGRMIERARERMHLRQRLDDQLRELKGFSNALIHDIRAPIRHARFLCQEAMDALGRRDRGAVVHALAGIDQSCERMSALLASLVQHMQAEEPCEMNAVSMRALVSETLEDLAEEIDYSNAKITCGKLPDVVGDPKQLLLVLKNLVRNSICYKADRAPGIRISAGPLVSGMVTYSVSDNGIGIDVQHHEKVFEPFRRLHAEADVSGRGLGLATCRKIVERHGGRIWCDSVAGKGSKFSFTLPTEIRRHAGVPGGELERMSRLLGEV